MRNYGPTFLAIALGGLVALVIGLMLATAHSQARLSRVSVFSLIRLSTGNDGNVTGAKFERDASRPRRIG